MKKDPANMINKAGKDIKTRKIADQRPSFFEKNPKVKSTFSNLSFLHASKISKKPIEKYIQKIQRIIFICEKENFPVEKEYTAKTAAMTPKTKNK